MTKIERRKAALVKAINNIHWLSKCKGHIMDINFRSKKVLVRENYECQHTLPFTIKGKDKNILTFLNEKVKVKV